MRIVYFIILFTFVWNYAKNQGLTNSLNEIADMNNVLGAKNLLPNEGDVLNAAGITYTENSDGTITISGVATESSYYGFMKIYLDAGTYILSGCPDINNPTIKAELYIASLSEFDYGSGVQFTLNTRTLIDTVIKIESGTDLSTAVTFYPMLRPASIQDDTYVPYSMTNRELSDNISNVYTKAEVDELTEGYILQGTHRVRVSSNSTTTTFGELVNSLYNETASYLNTLTNVDYYQIVSVRVTGNDVKFVNADITAHTALGQLEQNLYMMIKLGATLYMYDIEVRNNASRVYKLNNDGTLTEVTNNIIGYQKNLDYYINLYHHN